MAQAKIETLTSASVSGNSYVILPRTHTKAIVDDNGTTADDMFNNTVFQGDAEQEVRVAQQALEDLNTELHTFLKDRNLRLQ